MALEFTCNPDNFELTEAMRQSFRNRGYVLIRGFLSDKEVEKIKASVEHERYLRYGFRYTDPDTGMSQIRKVMWRHPGDDVIGMLTRCHKMVDTSEQLLGNEVYHYHTKLMTKPAKTGWEQYWHQDYGYWYKNGNLFPNMLSVFVPLDHCTLTSGCLQILEGSHLAGRVEHDMKEGQTGADPDRVSHLMDVCPLHTIPMEPGDVLFFHCNLLHASGRNLSEHKRWALIPCYNRHDNSPVCKHHHPQYTPISKVKDSDIATCQNMDDLSGKEFNMPGEDVTSTK